MTATEEFHEELLRYLVHEMYSVEPRDRLTSHWEMSPEWWLDIISTGKLEPRGMLLLYGKPVEVDSKYGIPKLVKSSHD